MTTAQKKNLRIFTILTLFLLVSTTYIVFMKNTAIRSIDRFACIQDDIKSVENERKFYGPTDDQTERIEALQAERREIAKDDPIFALCLEAHHDASKVPARNLFIAFVALTTLFAFVASMISLLILVLRLYYHAKRYVLKMTKTCNREKNKQMAKVYRA